MSTPAVRWVGLALWLARNPGMRRRVLGDSAGDPSGLAAALDRVPPGWEDAARAEIECAARLGVDVVTIEEEAYPPLLRRSADPPPILYVRGRLLPDDRLAVAVVGARRATPQGSLLASGLAASTRRRTAALSRPAAAPSPCSDRGSTGFIRSSTGAWRKRSRDRGRS
jgi:hypothetical protein